MRAVEHPLTVLIVDAVARAGVGGYVILYLGVAASWVGVPIVGAGVLAAAGVLASEGELDLWLVIVVATVAAWTGGYVGYPIGSARATPSPNARDAGNDSASTRSGSASGSTAGGDGSPCS